MAITARFYMECDMCSMTMEIKHQTITSYVKVPFENSGRNIHLVKIDNLHICERCQQELEDGSLFAAIYAEAVSFLQTEDDIYKDNWYDTDREISESVLTKFVTYLFKKEFLDRD